MRQICLVTKNAVLVGEKYILKICPNISSKYALQ